MQFNPAEFKSNELLDAVASVLNAGVDIIRLSDSVGAGCLLDLSMKLKQLCAQYDAMFILENRVDVAYLAAADGVFLRSGELSVNSARKLLGEDAIIGLLVGNKQETLEAIKNGADYIVLNSIFSTPNNPTFESVGLEYAKWVSENIYITAFVEDNAENNNIPEIMRTDISRISVIYSKNSSLSPVTATEKFVNLTNLK
ncbi:MAG: thiamine phosphate synthase [Candidatus Gastranaerophilales bacterium]|nr:thiamine phosphate synthase [Candidatus Gastranaerophilales bacterium]